MGTRQAADLDDVDLAMLRELEADGRVSFSELAERVHISRANVYRRIDRMQQAGVIQGFTVRTDPRALGRDITALVFIDAEQGSWRDVHDELEGLPGVEWLAVAAGSFDFVMLVRVASMDDLRDTVLERLQVIREVRSTETVFVLDETRPGRADT